MYLYKDGDIAQSITGGYERSTCWFNTASGYANVGSLTFNTTNMVLVTGNGSSNSPATAFKTVNPIIVRDYSWINIEGSFNGNTFKHRLNIHEIQGALYVGFAVRGYSTVCDRYFGVTSDMNVQASWKQVSQNIGTYGSTPKLTHTIFAIWLEKTKPRLNLYSFGDECSDVTGGWIQSRSHRNYVQGYQYTGSVTKNAQDMTLSSAGSVSVITTDYIDMSGYTSLNLSGFNSSGTAVSISLDITSITVPMMIQLAISYHSTGAYADFCATGNIQATPTYLKSVAIPTVSPARFIIREIWLE